MAIIWHYIDENGVDAIKAWVVAVPKRQRIKLQQKIDMLASFGSSLPPQLLADTGVRHIKKLKIQGNPKLRPLLCKLAATNDAEEFVLLVGAFEIDWEFDPPDALTIAVFRREEVINHAERRTKHTRLTS